MYDFKINKATKQLYTDMNNNRKYAYFIWFYSTRQITTDCQMTLVCQFVIVNGRLLGTMYFSGTGAAVSKGNAERF